VSEPIDNYFAWVEDGQDGREGIIATIVPGMPSGEPTPLQGGSYEFVFKLRPLAEKRQGNRSQGAAGPVPARSAAGGH
jgi:hypothetical protein